MIQNIFLNLITNLINVFLDIALPFYDMSKIQSLLFYESTYIKKVILVYIKTPAIKYPMT